MRIFKWSIIRTYRLEYLEKCDKACTLAEALIDKAIEDGLGRQHDDPRVHVRLFAHKVARALDGEQG